jgi:protein SCO1/2
MKRILVLWIVSGVVLAAAMTLSVAMASRPYQFHGSLLDPAQPAYQFSLVDTQGKEFRLEGQRGKVVLIFFGYTSCTDACPATLADLKEVKTRLGKDAGSVEVIFVTVDPEWDTPARLGEYLAAFDPHFIGLRGPLDQLQPVWKEYGVLAERNQAIGQGVANVTHSTTLYLIDPQGNLRLTYSSGFEVSNVVEDIRHILK